MAMQGTLDDRVLDGALAVLDTEVDKIVICSQAPTTYTEANATYMLGYKTSYAVGSPANRSGGGREVSKPAVSGGTVQNSGTATHHALIDTVNSRLLEVKALSASQAVTAGNTWSTTAATKTGSPSAT
jgi:hypothetical protein